MVDFKVRLYDGQYHDVDSSEMAFKIAGSLAYREAMSKAGPTILEPVMQVEVYAPAEYMGDLMGDLSSRRGQVQGMDAEGDRQTIRALVPMAEMLTYGSTLRSITQGRGDFHMDFSHYAEVPAQVREKIVAESGKKQTAEAEA
jgi:elongation factor G